MSNTPAWEALRAGTDARAGYATSYAAVLRVKRHIVWQSNQRSLSRSGALATAYHMLQRVRAWIDDGTRDASK